MIKVNSKFSDESIDRVAQSIYEFDSAHRGYAICWKDLEEHIKSEYLYEAECTIEAVIEELGADKIMDETHIKHLAETMCRFNNKSKMAFSQLSQETQQYYIDLAKVAAETIYGFYSSRDD